MMRKEFKTEEDFLAFLHSPYQFDKCGMCQHCVEVSIESVYISVGEKTIEFEDLPLLKCTSCAELYLTDYAKEMLGGAYSKLKIRSDMGVQSRYNGYKKRFNYCQDVEFDYDHRDYTSIPGLCYDEEHPEPGFLQPIYFSKEALKHSA